MSEPAALLVFNLTAWTVATCGLSVILGMAAGFVIGFAFGRDPRKARVVRLREGSP